MIERAIFLILLKAEGKWLFLWAHLCKFKEEQKWSVAIISFSSNQWMKGYFYHTLSASTLIYKLIKKGYKKIKRVVSISDFDNMEIK